MIKEMVIRKTFIVIVSFHPPVYPSVYPPIYTPVYPPVYSSKLVYPVSKVIHTHIQAI